MKERRVVVTGLGVISAVGNTPAQFFDNLLDGKSGVRRSRRYDEDIGDEKPYIAAEADFDAAQYLAKKQIGLLDRYAQMGLAAAGSAIEDAGLKDAPFAMSRKGVYWGSAMGGIESLMNSTRSIHRDRASQLNPKTVVRIMTNAAAAAIAIDFGFQGPCLTYSNACASSTVSIGEAYRAIRFGLADAMVAGGSEAVLRLPSIRAWEAMQTLATEYPGDVSRSCQPFSKGRSGFVLGEGAACVVLEDMQAAKERGAKIYVELISYSSNCDATHITKPSLAGQAEVMRSALALGGLAASDVQYINAHGTATLMGDAVETAAIKAVFGDHAYRLAVSSTKSMHGHVMGATGAMEFVATVMAVCHKAIPPTANWMEADTDCDLDYVPNTGRRDQRVECAMSNSFAFGGTNASLLVRELSE